jgi:predicted alpha/beta superfamily hydrolase
MKQFSEDFRTRLSVLATGVLGWLAVGLFQVAMTSPAAAVPSPGDDTVQVVFSVRLEKDFLARESSAPSLFLAGNLEQLGSWRPDGVRLDRQEDGEYRATVTLEVGKEVEFKVTAGSWGRVERDAHGRDIANRRVRIDRLPEGKVQRVEVLVAGLASGMPRASTVTGKLVTHPEVPSKFLKSARKVAVWLPEGYDASSEAYPVLYLQDGQNLFDAATAAFGVEWQADESAERLIAEKQISAVILVGIWNTADRIAEYTMTVDPRIQQGGSGGDYLRFLVEELKPMIDETYRTRPDRGSTWIGGSSLGGLIALHACLEHPEVFGGCLALSPTLGWDDERLLKELEGKGGWPENLGLWFSMGTSEGSTQESRQANVARSRRLEAIVSHGRADRSGIARYTEIPDGKHREQDWVSPFSSGLHRAFAR